MKNRFNAYGLVVVLCAAFLFMTAGCGVPKHMRVRSGVDPRYQDDDVRFRTTYYFRTFDPDTDNNESGVKGTHKDSLYRFRMTGKAHSLSNKVHFESGILHKDEIDPFGAAVVYDEKLGRYRFVSQSETKQEAVRYQQYAELDKLLNRYEALYKKKGKGIIDDDDLKGMQTEYATQIKNIIKNIKIPGVKDNGNGNSNEEKDVPGSLSKEKAGGSGPASSTNVESHGSSSIANPAGAKDEENGNSNNSGKGFQILGPQGWKTFDQDERLILAMTSSGKPLISGMRELSNRVLNEQPNTSEILLPLVNEQLKISKAERQLDSAALDKDKSMEEIIGNTLKELENDSSRKEE